MRKSLRKMVCIAAISCISAPAWCAHSNSPADTPSSTHAPGSMLVATGDITYYAADGDTLISIAQNITSSRNNWIALGKVNHIGNDRRIAIGTPILIPANLLPDEKSEASISAFSGQVGLVSASGATIPTAIGSKVDEGAQVTTSNNGFVTFALPDGSHFSLPSNSKVKLTVLRMARYTKSPRTDLTLIEGNVESHVSPLESNKGRYEVHSTLASAGVRGTHFRVAVLAGTDSSGVANAVLSGVVAVGAGTKPASLSLTAGNGSVVNADGVGKPVPLLPAPSPATGETLQERPTIQFTLNEVAHANSYHGQIARDGEAQNVLAEAHTNGNKIKIDGLADGDYFLRVTAVDALGLEGLQNIVPFKLKARPVPPFSSQPRSKVRADHVDFSWIEAPDAQYYHLQVAKDAAFHEVLIDQPQLSGLQFASDKLVPGRYYWRTASVAVHEGKTDHGPFNDVQFFDLFEPQKMADVADNGGNDLTFNWPGETGQKFLLQIGRDPTFSSLLLSKETDIAEIRLDRPEAGVYYVRVKAIDPDGYVGAFSAAQKFTIYSRWMTGSGGVLKSDGGGPARAGF